MKFLLLFFTITFHGQILHHQMLSSQGSSKQTQDSFIIQQTIGQQSPTGTAVGKTYTVMQGFQQSLWHTYITPDNVDHIDNITVLTYPNPFTENINFQFSKPVTNIISIYVFDLLGRLIYEKKKNAVNSVLTIDLTQLPTSEYLIRLNTTNLNYYAKIIKQ